MTVESATYISDLNATYPTGAESNDTAEGDNHLRLIKSTIKATFPNIDGAVTATQTEINTVVGLTATAAELNILDGATLSTTELNYLDGVTSAIQTQLDAKAPGNPTISVKIDNFNAASGYHYILRTNSSKTVTFPASPTAGQYFWVTNHSGGNWTGARNSENIMGAASNDTLATGKHYEYRYIDSTTGWARTRSN